MPCTQLLLLTRCCELTLSCKLIHFCIVHDLWNLPWNEVIPEHLLILNVLGIALRPVLKKMVGKLSLIEINRAQLTDQMSTTSTHHPLLAICWDEAWATKSPWRQNYLHASRPLWPLSCPSSLRQMTFQITNWRRIVLDRELKPIYTYNYPPSALTTLFSTVTSLKLRIFLHAGTGGLPCTFIKQSKVTCIYRGIFAQISIHFNALIVNSGLDFSALHSGLICINPQFVCLGWGYWRPLPPGTQRYNDHTQ